MLSYDLLLKIDNCCYEGLPKRSIRITAFLCFSWTLINHTLDVGIIEKKFNKFSDKAVLEPRVSPAFAITYFCNHCNIILDLKIHQSMWIHWPFFPKTWTKGHWPLDDLWPHICWSHVCDSTQGSLCPSPMGIYQCMWIQWSILQITTYIHILHTTYIHTYIHTMYRMSDHIVSYWTQFRWDKKEIKIFKNILRTQNVKIITMWKVFPNRIIIQLIHIIKVYDFAESTKLPHVIIIN